MRERIAKWWSSPNDVFTEFTNSEVVITHAVLIGLLLACGLAEWIDSLPW